MSRTNFDQLLQAGCHFGHLKRKWNPAMAPYIFMERNGIHIIDLNKTVAKIDDAAEALKAMAKAGKKILFVATKKQAKEIVAEKAASVNMPYVNERWAGGTLTNFPTIRKAVKKMTNIDKLMSDGTFANLSKRIVAGYPSTCEVREEPWFDFRPHPFAQRPLHCRRDERAYRRERGQSPGHPRVWDCRYQLRS